MMTLFVRIRTVNTQGPPMTQRFLKKEAQRQGSLRARRVGAATSTQAELMGNLCATPANVLAGDFRGRHHGNLASRAPWPDTGQRRVKHNV